MYKITCPHCGEEVTVCYWSDIFKPKNGDRKIFTILEPIPLDKDSGEFQTDKVRKDYPESDFYSFADTPSAFDADELTEFDATYVGAHCVKCHAKLTRKEGVL